MGSISHLNIPALVAKLTLEEKIDLLAGKNFWETREISRVGIPSLKVSDGPNGARGAQIHEGTKAACFPACVSLAATFNVDFPLRLGHALAEETLSKGARALLGPTVCPHRHPRGGRNFESFSEDPLLTGRLAGLYIKGLQERGVSATIKHFAGNEQETERFTMNVNVGEKALREIYLKPFEIAIKEGKPWAVMTSYSLINGTHCDASEWLLQKVLRNQWGFDGLTMSDWGGVNTVVESLKAGLDLEMPGPARVRKQELVKSAIEKGDLTEKILNDRVTAILKLLEKTGCFSNPDIPEERAIDKKEHRELIRQIGAEGIVLLKNDENVLPLKPSGQKIAMLGQSKDTFAHGGGSASVNAHYKVSPWEAFQQELKGVADLAYSKGAHVYRAFSPIKHGLTDLEGNHGCTLTRFNKTKEGGLTKLSVANIVDSHFSAIEELCDTLHVDFTYQPSVSGNHYLEFISTGPANLFINNEEVMKVQNKLADQMAFILGGANGEKRQYLFEKGKEYNIHIETSSPEVRPDKFALLEGVIGLTLGMMLQEDFEEDLLTHAVETAKAADVALVFVGNTPAWESEGCDQFSMNLPAYGSQDRLINAVADVNPNTIIIISTGTPILMPWLSKVKAVVQTWFPGQEAGNSIADVLLGKTCPSGRLPVTFPVSEEATPGYGNFPGDVNTLQVYYKEESFIGHRYYKHHPESVLFPFGFGLSYTSFKMDNVKFSHDEGSEQTQRSFKISIRVINIGQVAGSEVVQVYVTPFSSNTLPLRKLVGFNKVALAAGDAKSCTVEWKMDTFTEWNETASKWLVEKGKYEVEVASSSAAKDVVDKFNFHIENHIWIEP